MKKSVFIVLLLTVSVFCLRGLSQTQPDYPKKFHIENNMVVDDAKKPFVFKGISTRDPVAMYAGNASFQNECVPFEEKLFKNIKSWGANIVRLPVLPFTWKLQGKNNTLKALDMAVEWAAKNNMYVMICYQASGWPSTDNPSDKSTRTTSEELYGFWNEVSKHFKGNRTVVMYEIFSEPVTKEFMKITERNWVEWTDVMSQLIESIQRTDPEAICLVSGLSWAHDISFVAGYPINRKNVGYAVHPYPFESQLSTMKNLRVVSSVAKKYFVFVTEVGYDFELLVNMNDVQKKILELYPEIKPQMDEVRRLSGNKLYYSDLNKKLFDSLLANERCAAYLKEVVENYQKELKKTFDTGNISWIAWCMSCSWRPCLIKDMEYNPTDSGEFFRNWLQGKK